MWLIRVPARLPCSTHASRLSQEEVFDKKSSCALFKLPVFTFFPRTSVLKRIMGNELFLGMDIIWTDSVPSKEIPICCHCLTKQQHSTPTTAKTTLCLVTAHRHMHVKQHASFIYTSSTISAVCVCLWHGSDRIWFSDSLDGDQEPSVSILCVELVRERKRRRRRRRQLLQMWTEWPLCKRVPQ